MVVVPFEVPNKLYSIFVQDEWKVLPNLVVNAGIRYDDQKVDKGDDSRRIRPEQPVVAAPRLQLGLPERRVEQALRLGAGGSTTPPRPT